MKEKNKFWLNFIIRAIVGMGIIFLANKIFAEKGIALEVGFNAVSVLVSGFLGLPGVMMLYGIVAVPIL